MNDANISPCEYSADILPYMYGELADRARMSFESHLLDCGACTDEFADVSAARYEVYEWRKLEFDPLMTPRFEIPYEQGIVSATWFDRLRASVASAWAAPAFAAGALLIVAGFAAFFIFTRDGGSDIASINSNVSPPEDARTPAATLPEIPKGRGIDMNRAAETIRTDEPPVRIATPNRRSVRGTPKIVPGRSTEVRAESAPKKRSVPPTLNEFADEEDTSLRLAELLDDVETSD